VLVEQPLPEGRDQALAASKRPIRSAPTRAFMTEGHLLGSPQIRPVNIKLDRPAASQSGWR